MSNPDSFIEEVSEEVRKDQLFAMYKKYGWIALAVVVIIVGGASYLEYSKAQGRSVAQQRGDALIAALNVDDAAERASELSVLAQGGAPEAAIAGLNQASVLIEQGDKEGALAVLNTIKDGSDPLYSQLANLKAIMLAGDDMDMDQRMTELDALANPGAPFRVLALEQKAVALLDGGKTDEAVAQLIEILDEPLVSSGLRNRTQQLIVALGGELPERANPLADGTVAQ